jgi:hypothetical protein
MSWAMAMETQMRLLLLSSSGMSPKQRVLYNDMRDGIETNFKGFTAIDEAGALIGPWNPWLGSRSSAGRSGSW